MPAARLRALTRRRRTMFGRSVRASDATTDRAAIRHVLLLSVDGMHQVDLTNWIATHPDSNLAKLSATGVEYRDAHTPTPSDSFPGLAALVTGGTAAR